MRPEVNARREKRGTYRDGDPGVGGGRPPRTIYESSSISKGHYKGFNAQKQRNGEKDKLALARRAKMTKPLRYPKNSASKLSVTYGADFVQKKTKETPQARSSTKLPGIKSAKTPKRRPKTTPVKPSRSAVQPVEFRTQPVESHTRTTIDLSPVDKKSVKKKRTQKKKFVIPNRRKSSKQSAEILEQQVEHVSHGRYISIRGSLKLGSNKIKVAIEDITSGTVYKTTFELDEEAAQTAQDDTEQGNRILRVVVLASDLVPNRDKNGLRKKKAWLVEINPEQLQAALEVNHEIDEQDQNQLPTPTRRAATASRDRRAREHEEPDQEEDEFSYFNERACPPIQYNQSKKLKPQTPQDEKRQRPLSYKTDMSMDAPPFRTKIDDIVFKCERELDYRPMDILVAYRPLDGSITLQAHDASIEHYWRLVVRTRPKDAPPGADDGLNNLDIKGQLQALEGLVGMLEIRNTSDFSLGKLEMNMFNDEE